MTFCLKKKLALEISFVQEIYKVYSCRSCGVFKHFANHRNSNAGILIYRLTYAYLIVLKAYNGFKIFFSCTSFLMVYSIHHVIMIQCNKNHLASIFLFFCFTWRYSFDTTMAFELLNLCNLYTLFFWIESLFHSTLYL